MEKIIKKGPQCFWDFLVALKETGQLSLAKELDNTLKRKWKNNGGTTIKKKNNRSSSPLLPNDQDDVSDDDDVLMSSFFSSLKSTR